MSKVRVYEVAKQLSMDPKAVIELFRSVGAIDVKNHMSAVEQDVVDRVKRHLERQKAPPVVEQRISATVVKRKVRPAEGPASTPGVEAQVPSARASQPAHAVSPPPAAPPIVEAEPPPPPPPSKPAIPPPPSAPASRPSGRASSRRAAPPAPVDVEAVSFDEAPRPAPTEEPKKIATLPEPVVEPPPPPPPPPPSPPPPAPEVVKAEPPPPPPPPPPPARVEPVAPPRPPVVTSAPPRVEEPRRPSQPPKTGIETWGGRPGVPMPQKTPPRRTTYDNRAGAGARPPGGPMQGGRPRPGGVGGPGRPGFGRGRIQGGAPTTKRTPMPATEMASHKKVIKIEEQVGLQTLAGRMSMKATDVLMKLLGMGMTNIHINTTLDADTAKILASEFGWTVEDVAIDETQALSAAVTDAEVVDADTLPRPPIVTVMGHVDHGKTSLLDRIRKANVADGEAGGITQHVGAYRVETPRGTVAFLDTPGHEAFTAMRARGASVTDIVILVVAADDGVMPQTKEAIAHAQAAKVPIVVALNKIDKPNVDPDKIKRELAQFGLQPEEWGGETMFAPVSAKTGQGIDQLLESVLLQAEVLELRANPKKRASGTVIEALLDRGRGPVARVMIQDGTLRTGDVILAGGSWGKVRAMTDELGRAVGEAGPSTPVEVLGLNEVPSAGDPVHVVKDARTAEEIAETRRKKANKSLIPQDARVSLEDLGRKLSEHEQLELKLIVKGDVQGSVEAVTHAFSKLTTQRVKVTVVHAAVGGITEGDVNLAVASKAIIVGFNVRPAGKAAAHAEAEGIEIRLYNIIYNAVDDIKAAMEGLLPATRVEKILGRAEVRQIFRLAKFGQVCGCMVLSGVVRRTADVRLVRDNIVVWTGKLAGLRRFKDDAKEVAEGFECGISLEGYQDVKERDVVECFEVEEVKTKLF